MSLIDIGERCVECGRSVAIKSGHYVNRIPASTSEAIGYLCSDCQLLECDRCGQPAFEPITVENAEGYPEHVCEDCITEKERELHEL